MVGRNVLRRPIGVRLAHAVGALKTDDLKRITVDTTVQPKNVTHPTDAKLMLKAIEQLGRLARTHDVALRQSYARVGITDSDVARYAATGISSTGCHIQTAGPYSHSPTGRAELMRTFSASVRRSGLACHFHGVHEKQSLTSALLCGARYISGEIIGPFAEHPMSKHHFGASLSRFLPS